MKLNKNVTPVLLSLALGASVAHGQNASDVARSGLESGKNLGKGALSAGKGIGKGALNAGKGLLSMPGKAANFGTDALPDLSKGTQEFGLGGNVQFSDDFLYNLDLTYGYFFYDNWEFGITANLQGADTAFGLGIGIFTEYNFDLDSKWVPFVGLSTSLASISVDEDLNTSGDVEDLTSISFGATAGVKYFLRENIAITASIDFQVSPDDVFAAAESASNAASNISIGTRFYF